MFYKAFGLAFLTLLTLSGLAGTAIFGAMYLTRDTGLSSVEAEGTARASYEKGHREGFADGKASGIAEASACDTIVGAKANSFAGAKPGDKVGMTIQIRSSKTGAVYEVQSPQVCTVSDDLRSCRPDPEYGVGNKYPILCGIISR